MFGLWSVSAAAAARLPYRGCPVRLRAETHWKLLVRAFTNGPACQTSPQTSQKTERPVRPVHSGRKPSLDTVSCSGAHSHKEQSPNTVLPVRSSCSASLLPDIRRSELMSHHRVALGHTHTHTHYMVHEASSFSHAMVVKDVPCIRLVTGSALFTLVCVPRTLSVLAVAPMATRCNATRGI